MADLGDGGGGSLKMGQKGWMGAAVHRDERAGYCAAEWPSPRCNIEIWSVDDRSGGKRQWLVHWHEQVGF